MRRLLLVLLLVVPAFADDAPVLKAGFAVVDLTPDRPVPLGGYAARMGRLSTGVHDPIQARAMVLEEGEDRLALVTLDLVGVSTDVRETVMRRTKDLDLDEVILAASHTHAGPGGLSPIPIWKTAMGPFDARLYARVVARIEAAIRLAASDMDPVRLRAGRRAATGLSRNRRGRPEYVPDSIGLVRIDDLEGKVRGVIVHHAAHPILVPWSVRELSAGWPGAMRRRLAKELPGATAMFLQGAAGDLSPVVPEGTANEPFARVEAYGAAVAKAALEGLEAMGTGVEHGGDVLQLAGTTDVLLWTSAGVLLGRPDASALAPEAPFKLPVTRVVIDGIPWVTVPGEPTYATRSYFERGAWRLGCAQGHFGYFADQKLYRRGDAYEAEMSLFGPRAAWELGWRSRFMGPGWYFDPAPAHPVDGPVVLRNSSCSSLGSAHGETLRGPIRDLLADAEAHIEREAMRRGAGVQMLPLSLYSGIRGRDLVVPMLIRAARRLQRHVPPEYLDEMESIATAAGVPYDAILLENVYLTLAEQPDPGALLSSGAHCTNAVVSGDATSMGQLLHLSTLDWGMKAVLRDKVLTLVMEPAHGHPFVSVTWPGMVGTLRAMSAQGIAVSEESTSAGDDTRMDGVPINILLRQVVQHASSLDEAVEMVTEAPGTCGYKITISDGRELDARVVEVTATKHHVRRPVGGMLFGCDPNAPPEAYVTAKDEGIRPNDGSSARRYPALRNALEPLSGRLRIQGLLGAITAKEGGIRNDGTLLACVFEPQVGRYWTSLGKDVDARLPEARWQEHDLLEQISKDARSRYRPPWHDLPPLGFETETRIEDLAGVKVETVRFRSPVRSGRACNDVVEAELFTPTDPVGVVIQLPHWREPRGAPGQRLVAAALSQQGLAVLLLPLPWQYGRAVPGVGSGAWTLSRDLARTREAAFQAAAEICRVGLWLERERGFPTRKQAILGTSLGGHVGSLAMGAYPDRFGAGVFVLAAADVAETIYSKNGVTDGIRKQLMERGVTKEEARYLVEDLDPARFARPEDAAKILLVAGDADPVAPKPRVEALAKAWGGARIYYFPGGHYAAVRHLPGILKAVVGHLKGRFEAE